MSKGSRNRTKNHAKYREGYRQAFGHTEPIKAISTPEALYMQCLHHSNLYYNHPDRVEISDYEYDMLLKRLEEISPELADKVGVGAEIEADLRYEGREANERSSE
jgi:hypothetical protein